MESSLAILLNQIGPHQAQYPLDEQALLQLGRNARQEVESFINTYIDDPTMGWPVVSYVPAR